MGKHTKGTWVAVGGMIEHTSDRVADIASFRPSDFGQDHFDRSTDEIFANARLCAAAPDMLDEIKKQIAWLQYIRAELVGKVRGSLVDGVDQSVKYLSAAASKAEGGPMAKRPVTSTMRASVTAPDMLAVLQRARAAFRVEYNAAGDPIGVSHGSDALRDLVRELDQIIGQVEGSEPGALPEPLRNIDTQRELRLFAADRGRRWKVVLRGYWERGEPVPGYPHLYGLRNSLGPSWLDAFQLPKREVGP